MSKLPAVVVQLSSPLTNRWYNGNTYCCGMVARKEIADNLMPLVSSFIQVTLDDNFDKVFEVKTVYAYDSRKARENQTWHEFCAIDHFDNMKQAVAVCESQMRECYAHALALGIASELDGVLQ